MELLDPKEEKCFWLPCRLEVKDIHSKMHRPWRLILCAIFIHAFLSLNLCVTSNPPNRY